MAMHSASSNPSLKASVLNSWKEIGCYLGCAVRTVQRYEKDSQLPVRRLPGKNRGVVIAFPEDLDAWLRYRSTKQVADPRPRTLEVMGTTHDSVNTSAELRRQSQTLRSEHREEMMRLHEQIGAVLKTIVSAKAADGLAHGDSVCSPILVNDGCRALPASKGQGGTGEIAGSSSVSGME